MNIENIILLNRICILLNNSSIIRLLLEIEKSAKEWAHLECDVEFNKKWVHLECDVEFN